MNKTQSENQNYGLKHRGMYNSFIQIKQQGGITMLTAGALNGIAIWFRNIINWFRRIWYALNHAVVISAVSEMGTATRGGNLDAEYDFRFFRFADCTL